MQEALIRRNEISRRELSRAVRACRLALCPRRLVWSRNPAIAWAALILGAFLPYSFVSYRGKGASKKSKSFFPKPSTPWPAPSAPDTPSPPPWK